MHLNHLLLLSDSKPNFWYNFSLDASLLAPVIAKDTLCGTVSILLLSKPLPGRSYVTSLWSTSYISSLSSGSFIWRFVKFVLRLTYVKKYSLSLFFNGLDWRIFCTS